MAQFSDEVLDFLGTHRLSDLTVCGAQDIPTQPEAILFAFQNFLSGAVFRDPAVRRLGLAFLKRTRSAINEYRAGRAQLSSFIEWQNKQDHRILLLLDAISHFENCIGRIAQAVELHDATSNLLTNGAHGRSFVRFDQSSLDRINELNNATKHFDVERAKQASTPIWITDTGVAGVVPVSNSKPRTFHEIFVSFDELRENIFALDKVVQKVFYEVPQEAIRRAREKAGHPPTGGEQG